MSKKRSYDQGCAAAHALDLVGERWALLVVRELLLGPKRFTDLKAGLPTISPNVLSRRLSDLEAIGAVRQRKLPPPAAAQVYELTDWGMELEPVIMALGRWGARSPEMPFTAPTSVTSLIVALQTMFGSSAAVGLEARYELKLGEETFRVVVADGQLSIVRGTVDDPDARLESDPETMKGLAFGALKMEQAVALKQLEVTGDEALAERFFSLFKLPEPVETAA